MKELLLEDEFEALLINAYSARSGKAPSPGWLTALGMRAGIHGSVKTLEESAGAAGVTRERMRQVFSEIGPHLKGAQLSTLSPVIQEILRHSPVVEPVGELLSSKGLARPTLTGPALLNLMKIIGVKPGDVTGTGLICDRGWVYGAGESYVLDILPTARKHTSKYGMTNIEEIRQALAAPDRSMSPESIKKVLCSDPAVKWHGEWLWVEKERDGLHSNRLINCARAVLSVNSPQTVVSIHEGARRVWKFRKLDILPPVEAMRGFFSASPHFIVENDVVSPVKPLDYHDVLGGTTASMVDVLKSTPHQVMDRRTLSEACAEAGLSSSTVSIWMTFAEWMENIAPNVWGLRGSNPHPAVVEQIRADAKARSAFEVRRREFSWAADGTLEVTADITAAFLGSGTLTFDSASHRAVAGKKFKMIYEGVEVGAIKVGDEHCWSWGWSKVLSQHGAKLGDVLRANFDLIDNTATVVVGGEKMWS